MVAAVDFFFGNNSFAMNSYLESCASKFCNGVGSNEIAYVGSPLVGRWTYCLHLHVCGCAPLDGFQVLRVCIVRYCVLAHLTEYSVEVAFVDRGSVKEWLTWTFFDTM